QLLPLDERKMSQDEGAAQFRQILADYPSNRSSVSVRPPLGGGAGGGGGGVGGYPLAANVRGSGLDKLADVPMTMLRKRQASRSPADVRSGLDISGPEIRVAVDRRRAADLGVRMSTVGSTLRLMVAGDDEISTYKEGTEQYPVKIRVLESQRRDLDA